MVLKVITAYKRDIYDNEDERFDVKYFLVNRVFNKLKEKSACEVKTLDELGAEISSGSYIDTYVDQTKGVPYIRVGNIKPFSISEDEANLVYVNSDVPQKIKIKRSDIILGRTQATAAKLAVASLASNENRGHVISQHISKIELQGSTISPYFLVAYLNSVFYEAQTALATHGDTRVEFTHSQLRKVSILIPDKMVLNSISNKSKRIVELNFLGLEKIKEAQYLLYRKMGVDFSKIVKKNHFSVNLSEIVKGNLWTIAYSFPLYTDTLDAIQGKWQTVPLGKICTIRKGNEVGSANYTIGLEKRTEDVPFIRTSDLINYEVDQSPDYYVSDEMFDSLQQDVKSGDVLFTKDGKIGMTAMLTDDDKVIIASGIARLRVGVEASKHNITPEYLFTLLSLKETGLYPALRRTVVASTIPHLREARLEECEMPILDKNSIDEITKLVKEAFELKDKKKKLIKEVREKLDSYFIS